MEPVVLSISFKIDMDALSKNLRIEVDDPLYDELSTLAEKAEHVAKPKAIYKLVEINHSADGQKVSDIDGIPFDNNIFDINFKGKNRAFAYVTTCGAEFDVIDTNNDPLLEYWLDSIRLQAVRHTFKYLSQYLTEQYKLTKTAHLNPGSLPEWPITQQPNLFSLIGDVKGLIGVEITDSFLMRPVKSTSGILFETEKNYENCMLCQRMNCQDRRAPYDAEIYKKYNE